MDNPYWYSKKATHFIDKDRITILCFEILNLFAASKNIALSLQDPYYEDDVFLNKDIDIEDSTHLKLFSMYGSKQISNLLIQIAILVRLFDDQTKTSKKSAKYIEHLNALNVQYTIGSYSEKNTFSLRDACNKIIHCDTIRPIYDSLDGISKNEPNFYYLSGSIELTGKENRKKWTANLYLQCYIDLVMDLICFK